MLTAGEPAGADLVRCRTSWVSFLELVLDLLVDFGGVDPDVTKKGLSMLTDMGANATLLLLSAVNRVLEYERVLESVLLLSSLVLSV